MSTIFKERGALSYAVAYFALVGLALHVFVLGVWLFKPSLIWSLEEKVISSLENHANTYGFDVSLRPEPVTLAADDIPIPVWKAHTSGKLRASEIRVGTQSFNTLTDAAKALQTGDTLAIGPGVYPEALVIEPNGVTLVGHGHVVLSGRAAQGKAAIVIKGNDITVRNIECRDITVGDGNGACIRQEGRNLNVEHVYFHDSQTGILTGSKPGFVRITDSRFERLGHQGQAHGIYVGGGHLLIEGSQFLRSKGHGHEIKSRSQSTRITRSIVASLDGDDSRLIDLPGGGEITIENSVLQQGPNSVNYNLIGIGLEAHPHDKQSVVVRNNLIIMERPGGNLLYQARDYIPPATFSANVVISSDDPKLGSDNIHFTNRAKAGLGPYPDLPKLP